MRWAECCKPLSVDINILRIDKIRARNSKSIMVGDVELPIGKTYKEEISKLDKEWEELRQIYHKNNSKKDKIILPILQTQQINRAKNFKMTKYERYLLNVKMIMKNMEINPIGPVKQKISIRALGSWTGTSRFQCCVVVTAQCESERGASWDCAQT